MKPQFTSVLLNGSKTAQGNYVWGGALTLAWAELRDKFAKEPIALQSEDPDVLGLVHNFNNAKICKDDVDPSSYYICSGYGNETIRKINKEVREKFPQKTTDPLKESLPPEGIISYAYLFKMLQFEHPFSPKKVKFNQKLVEGFIAKDREQKRQILVHSYTGVDSFLVQAQVKTSNDQIFLLKSPKNLAPEEVAEQVLSASQEPPAFQVSRLSGSDEFEMPKIRLRHQRSVDELVDKEFRNKSLMGYHIAEIYEVINLDFDEKGVKVQNQGVIKALRSMARVEAECRKIHLNRPFWIVIKERSKNPYLIVKIENLG